jgi:hypothetical protein
MSDPAFITIAVVGGVALFTTLYLSLRALVRSMRKGARP